MQDQPVAEGTASRPSVDQTAGLSLSTPVATPTGWATAADLAVGDLVLDRDGRVQEVAAIAEHPVDQSVPSVVVAFANGVEIVCGPHQTWVAYSRLGRLRYQRSTPADRVAWRHDGIRHVHRVRQLRTATSLTAEAPLAEVLRMLRESGVARWRDLADFRNEIAPYVPTVNEKPPSHPAALWQVCEVLRYLDFRISRDLDAPFGRVVATCELPKLPMDGAWSVPLPSPLQLPAASRCEAGREHGAEVVLTGQAIAPHFLRGSVEQRASLLDGMVEASGLGGGVVRASREPQLRGITELLASLGAPHRVTWMRSPDDNGSHFRILFELPSREVPFVAFQALRAAPAAARRAITTTAPDGTLLITGLIVAHSR